MPDKKFNPPADQTFYDLISYLRVLLVLVLFAFGPQATSTEERFKAVADIVFSDPYDELPHYPVTKQMFGPSGDDRNNALRTAARRTLTTDQDLIEFPAGQKLFQPNGICYVGRWNIHASTPYTGVFARDTSIPAIVRISVMLGDVERGTRRTLGMGVKLFPPNTDSHDHSYNLLVMDSISGSTRDHVLHAVLDNHPDYGGLPSPKVIGIALRIRRDLNTVDKALSPAGPMLRYRSVSHLAAAGLPAATEPRAPHWVRLRVTPETPAIDAADFREELALKNYANGQLEYRIEFAAHTTAGKTSAKWVRAGVLRLTADIVSASCDRRLHFAHPKLNQLP